MNILTKNQQIIIIKFIHATGVVSSREIQESCNVSRKTLTFEIQEINEYLKIFGANIETSKGTGYLLKVVDERKYKEFCTQFLHDNQRNRYLYIERNYLAYFILFELVLQEGYISVEDLCDKFHYSRSTVSKSIKLVKNILNKYNCTLDSKPNYGLKFIANEWSKRICIIFFDKIAYRMNTVIPEANNVFAHVLDKIKYNNTAIELLIGNILRKHQVKIPLFHLTKINLYIILTQTRAEYYELLDFDRELVEMIKCSKYLSVSKEITEELRDRNFLIREKDIYAITILLTAYVTRESESDVDEDVYQLCKEDTLDLVGYLKDCYKGLDINLDDQFEKEFILYLAGVKERILFGIPSDEEIGFMAKHDGAFITDVCRDFAVFYYRKYGMKLSEAETLNSYYIFSSSFIRNAHKTARTSIALVSRFGIHFARNVAARLMQEYPKIIAEVHTYEFINVDTIDLDQYDALITDIEQKRYNFISIPIIKLDFFREPKESRVIMEYFTLIASKKLSEIIQDPFLIKDRNFTNKIDVFHYLALHYVPEQYREEFIEDCIQNDSYISFERCNRIVFIPTLSKYYDKKQITILFNKAPFIWDNDLAQFFILFTRKNQRYLDFRILNSALASFLHLNANTAQELPTMDAETMIRYIAEKNYK